MKIHRDLKDYSVEKAILTQGTFDGVHIGHKEIISRVIAMAKEAGGESVLLTFHPHPRHILFPDQEGPLMLSTLKEKISKLEEIGLDHLIIHPFTHEFSRLSAVQFVRDLLVNIIKATKIVVGYDHHFARNREGNLETLQDLSPLYDLEIEEISAQEINDVNISSTKIRKALVEGDLETANKYLGYCYGLDGVVVEGKKLGRTLGFPTANIGNFEKWKLIPKDGVYAVKVFLDGEVHSGMMSIGFNPTVNKELETRSLEVHILDFNRDIYGNEIRIEFVSRIRGEEKFKDLEALKTKMADDMAKTIHILEKA
ncbi:MAG: bifunctional riboflavin kinase/FAD synthetase [Flavobacteriales bacterium]|nr:bifunctional riboflavin kinase/FAD synthetase [Flavobacteriales bacterium]